MSGGRGFGLVTLASLVVASMIGAGIFTTSGFALADLGTPARVLWAWAAGAAIALCGAASYGMLARRMAESGGEYLYLSRTIHPAAGFIAGWVSLLAGFTGGIAFAASTLEAYLVPQGARPAWLPGDAVAVAAIVVGALLHGIRAEVGALTQNLTVILKVAVLAGFVLLGALFLADGPAAAAPAGPVPALSLSAFAMSVVWISLSYSGFNAAVYVAGEAEDPERTVPRALIIGTLVVSAVYLGLNAVFVLAPPAGAVAGAPDVAAVAGLFVVHAREGRRPVDGRAYPWAPALFVGATLALALLAARESPLELAAAGVTLASAALLYALIDRRRRAAA